MRSAVEYLSFSWPEETSTKAQDKGSRHSKSMELPRASVTNVEPSTMKTLKGSSSSGMGSWVNTRGSSSTMRPFPT